ncbi:type II toxin-antitoxin system ParD family antitoxin [Spirosoma sordidisoli]|nr:type II toxin-antitoxin system ParD family antitoxin [Spirosoma sordidisoli]
MKLQKVPIFGTFISGAIRNSNSMKRNTSITVGSHFETFIQDQIENGRYASTSEVVRAGLRLLEQEEEKLKALRLALIEGEKSGFIDNFDPQTFKEKLKQRHLV